MQELARSDLCNRVRFVCRVIASGLCVGTSHTRADLSGPHQTPPVSSDHVENCGLSKREQILRNNLCPPKSELSVLPALIMKSGYFLNLDAWQDILCLWLEPATGERAYMFCRVEHPRVGSLLILKVYVKIRLQLLHPGKARKDSI